MSGKRYYVKTRLELSATAVGHGCKVVFAEDNELLLDLDQKDLTFELWRAYSTPFLDILEEKFGIELFEHWRSRGGNLHVLVRLDVPVERLTAIALQAALGSDPKREIIACWEAEYGNEEKTGGDTRSLFRPKDAEVSIAFSKLDVLPIPIPSDDDIPF